MKVRELIGQLLYMDMDREIGINVRSVYKGKPCNITANIESVGSYDIYGRDDQFDELLVLGDYDE